MLSWTWGLKETKASDGRRPRHSVKCYEKSEEFLKGSINQRRNRKGQQEEPRQYENRCQDVTYIKANLFIFFIKRENLLVHICK